MLTYNTTNCTQKKQVVKDKGSLNPTSPPSKGWFPVSTTDFNRFPFNNFTYCLTLFSKFFSSFPHGTCSLSVSRLYLALGEIYLPFWAAIPNNSTLRKTYRNAHLIRPDGILTLHDTLSQRIWAKSNTQKTLLQITTRLGKTQQI